ncbi:hypothetical protein Sros01_01630 [Streptomyces roseochromogenus]|nr:hypothetical protein Sros01_01630 [Streptomyces roseochromogenus]
MPSGAAGPVAAAAAGGWPASAASAAAGAARRTVLRATRTPTTVPSSADRPSGGQTIKTGFRQRPRPGGPYVRRGEESVVRQEMRMFAIMPMAPWSNRWQW